MVDKHPDTESGIARFYESLALERTESSPFFLVKSRKSLHLRNKAISGSLAIKRSVMCVIDAEAMSGEWNLRSYSLAGVGFDRPSHFMEVENTCVHC